MSTAHRFRSTLLRGGSSLTTHAMSYPMGSLRGRSHHMPPHRIPRDAPVLVGLIASATAPTPAGRHRDHSERDGMREYRRAGAQFRREQRARLALGHKKYTAWLEIDRTKATPTPRRSTTRAHRKVDTSWLF